MTFSIFRNSFYQVHGYVVCLVILSVVCACSSDPDEMVRQVDGSFVVHSDNYTLELDTSNFAFKLLDSKGDIIVPAHEISGLQIGRDSAEVSNVHAVSLHESDGDQVLFSVATENGIQAKVKLDLMPHAIRMAVEPEVEGSYSIICRTGNPGPAYGMGDHAAYGPGNHDLQLNDFVRDPLEGYRMISNFVIFPQEGFASVNMEPGYKLVRITGDEYAQGSRLVGQMPAMYFFIGSPQEIYLSFLESRNREGYRVDKPKHEWFGVGWEAFGALAWMTNQTSVTENITQYLEYDYPLEWMVLGSGFWPRGQGEFDEHGTPYGSEAESEAAKKLQATTSFGMWDANLYPDPRGMIEDFHEKDLLFTIGLRIGFIIGGPFTDEGLDNDFFLKDAAGDAKIFRIGFPRSPIYLLDAKNADAVAWYDELCKKWEEYGVDGYKEDLFGYPQDLPDDLVDPVNRALMDRGVHIMGRNNYLGSPADIHRFEDFNYNQFQDRGPINGLSFAFSGFPYVYPDIIGGTGLATGRFGDESRDKLKTYLIRYAQYASLHPAMAFGYGPWNFDEETNRLCLEAARLHQRLKPHIFSNAIRAYETGFPWPMTPLPLAFPEDAGVYGIADSLHRNYQWMIGESLLAAPLYGNDYASSFSRAIYLPAGEWMDYESGKVYHGPGHLNDFDIPLDKTPLFVGGTGVVVEQEGDGLVARIYPMAKRSETVFFHTDGASQSKITVDVADWDELSVRNITSGEDIEVARVRHAAQFVLLPGQNYEVE